MTQQQNDRNKNVYMLGKEWEQDNVSLLELIINN